MDLSNLQPNPGSVKNKTRVGRGAGSGKGGTSTRGHKGAKSRSGYSRKIGFEGGQMPLQRRLPKFGFKPLQRVEYRPINLDVLQALAAERGLTKVGIAELIEAGRCSRKHLVKILAKGALTLPLTVEAHAFSEAAKKAIEEAGGTATKL